MATRIVKRTYGEAFPKFMIEVIAAAESDNGPSLLLWNGAEAYIASKITMTASKPDASDRTFYPPVIDSTTRNAIRFPARAESYDSTRKLFNGITDVLRKYMDLPENLMYLLAHCVFASWFVDVTAAPVGLSIVGPSSGQSSRLLRLLASLFRHSLLLGPTGLGAIFSLPLKLQPALFMDGGQCNGQLPKLLRQLSAPDSFVFWKGQLLQFRGAKVVCTEESLPSDLLNAGFIEVRIPPSRRILPILDQQARQQIAEEFQPKLLMYRLVNYHQVRASKFDVPEFPLAVRDLARSLAAAVPNEPELQSNIASLLQAQSDQDLIKPTSDLDSVVIETMLILCHQKDRKSFHVAEVSEKVNEILEARGESLDMNPWAVGRKLRKLDITTQRLDANGRGALLLNDLRHHVHSLAAKRGLLVIDPGRCSDCKELQDRGKNFDVAELTPVG
jgi:hypothetical protein